MPPTERHSDMITRQYRRKADRTIKKYDRNNARLKTSKMNPMRRKLLHGLSVTIAEHMEPTKAFEHLSDIPAYKSAQLHLAGVLNNEFMERSRGKSGKSPARRLYTKSVAFFTDRTNQIGHFA